MTRKLVRAAIVGSALIATLALAACSGSGPDTTANRDAQPNPTTSPYDPATESELEPEDAPAEDGRGVDLTATYTWQDGTTARITSIRRSSLGEFTTGNPATQVNLLLTVKLTAGRNGLALLDPTSSLQFGDDGVIAESDFVSEHMQGGPGGLDPGRSLTGSFDYLVPKGQEPLQLVFTFNPRHPFFDAEDPDSAHTDATFVGAA